MKRLLFTTILLMSILQSYAQSEVNMAIVDFDAALIRHPQYQNNLAIIDAQRKKLEAEIDTLSAQFNVKLQAYQAAFLDMSENDKNAAGQQLSLLEQGLASARTSYAEKMQEAEEKYMKPLEANVQDAINLVASQKGYNFVTGAGLFYVADSSRDITTFVIDLLNKP